MAILNITKETIDQAISQNNMLVIDFWAPWCGPCRTFGPIFEKVAAHFPETAFAKINTEEENALATAFKIRSIPTLMIFREGLILFAQPGMLPEKNLIELIQRAKEVDMEQIRQEIAKQSR